MRVVEVADRRIDSGPTVLTMRWVFDELFEACGARLEDELTLAKLDVLARHAWDDGSRLDLFSDPLRSRAAIAELAGESNAHGFDGFTAYARRIYEEVEDVFIRAERPSLGGFLARHGIKRAFGVARIDAHRTMWGALDDYFDDPPLKQLFARYATYSGSSPYDAPATLHLISHVEASGVWIVEGGIHRLAMALRSLLESLGGRVSTGERVREVEIDDQRARAVIADRRYEADAVIVNADAAALASGYFGRAAERAVTAMPPKARSLSAVLAVLRARPRERRGSRSDGALRGQHRSVRALERVGVHRAAATRGLARAGRALHRALAPRDRDRLDRPRAPL